MDGSKVVALKLPDSWKITEFRPTEDIKSGIDEV